jgi:DNA-directed DNA polymerase III PolC
MIPLTVRSHYSLMWGTASVPRICRMAGQMGYRRLALTDTDNLYGLWPFLSACEREGIRPIIGAELTDPARNHRAVCLVENDTGYRNLCRLITRRHTDQTFRLETALTAHWKGLVLLVKDVDLLIGCYDAGAAVFAAMPRRPLSPIHPLQRTARRLHVPMVATPGSFYLAPEDAAVHRILRAIERNTVLSRLDSKDVAPEDAWLAPPEEYGRRFAICPEAVRCAAELAERLSFTGPDFGLVLPPWHGRGGNDAKRCLRDAAYAGARRRYGEELSEPVVDRLEHELRIISEMKFSTYFLVVRDIVHNSPRTCGRGSGAASLVAYCLGITNVCPIKHNLYFERFLNPGRTDPPDIDVDFAWDERDHVLKTILDRHRGHAAMVSNHVLFQPRMAIREVAKVYGLTDAEIGRVSKRLLRFWRTKDPGAGLLTRLQRRPEMRRVDFPPPWPEIMHFAGRIVGTPRYLSVHPGGMVITPEPIDRYVPVESAPKGVPILQWEKDGTEAAGLVKIDLLGNRSLGVIRDALASVRENGIAFNEERWEPEDDGETKAAVAAGKTMGCFYIESPAMRLLQQKSGAGDFDHLVIHSSIIRPAANEFIREYIRRLHGGQWDPIHPLLADVLEDTFGIMVYQEDVSRVAVHLAGFSHAEADGLRKVLSKKDREHRLQDYYARFTSGAGERKVSQKRIDDIWAMMMSFDGYSFCKPHSASYARVSFQAAFLKVHFPAEFMAAVISNQGGFYSTFAYVSEARRMGLKILPPDVSISDIHWKGRRGAVRVGLLAVKGLGTETRNRIVALRRQAPYESVRDFFARVSPDEPEARALVHSGALDSLHPGGKRAELLWELAVWRKSKAKRLPERSLFDQTADRRENIVPPLPDGDERDRLGREFSVLGFLCDRHPMALYPEEIKGPGIVKAADLPALVGRRVRLAGWLITGKIVRTRHGDPMQFLTFEDDTDILEATFFPETYRRFCHMIDRGQPYLLSGKVEEDWGAVTLTVEKVEALAPVSKHLNSGNLAAAGRRDSV